ncbi:hypothetical protein MMC07_009481, partial [Pseudocyphellaria aurata]|nr:hypothetical protein [Pseudocyphellaria aurata]
MLQTRRNIIRATRRITSRQQRRYDSSHAASASETKSAHHTPHPSPVNESFSRGFYITVAGIPLSFVLYKYSVTFDDNDKTSQPALTRLIAYYSDLNAKWERRNTLHSDASAQAAFDRNLFQSTPASQHYELKFPDVFNTGSPYNVPAGHNANFDELIAHYKRQNAEMDKAARTRAAESSRKEP